MNDFEYPSLSKCFMGGVFAGFVAVIANVSYMMIYESITGFSSPEAINLLTVIGSSLLPIVVSSFVYYLLRRFLLRGELIFIALSSLLTLLSLQGPLAENLPNGEPIPAGFVGLTIPMHFIAGLCAIIVLPRFSNK